MRRGFVPVAVEYGRKRGNHMPAIVRCRKGEDELKRIHRRKNSEKNRDEGIVMITVLLNQSPENPSPVDIAQKYQMRYNQSTDQEREIPSRSVDLPEREFIDNLFPSLIIHKRNMNPNPSTLTLPRLRDTN